MKTWDVIVIGGGASGMMAAATAAASGTGVLLLEKNSGLGKKLRITGGGRCNVTNNKPNDREMLSMYRNKGKFLFSTFSQYSVSDSVSWFSERNVTLKEENEGRLFPTTDSADTIYETLVTEMKKNGVTVHSKVPVTDITKEKEGFTVKTVSTEYKAARCIIATGGTSRPDTGSTGDGFAWAKELGHTINSHDVALVPILAKELWLKEVSGISLTDISLSICVDGVRQAKEAGKVLFTHTGLSGPTILNLSKQIGELLDNGEVTIEIDLFPTEDIGSLRERITALLQASSNKLVRNVMSELAPTTLGKVILKNCGIDPETPCHSIRTEEKKVLVDYLKSITLTISGLMGPDKAVISSGGVAPEEVNFKTMESKIAPGIYLAGDMLDIDRPSGGYSLQLCWSTGFVAGKSAAS